MPLAEKMVTPDRKSGENTLTEPNPRHASRLKLWEPKELPQRLESAFCCTTVRREHKELSICNQVG
jgi:hypothetical protein